MWLYLVLSVVLVSYLLTKRTFSYWHRNDVPSVPGVFLVGSVWEALSMKKHIGSLAQVWYEQFSNLPYFGYYNCSTPVLMIRDVDIVKDVLIKDFNSFSRNEFQADEQLNPLLGTNAFMVSGDKWKHNRSIASPMFSNSRIKSVFPMMNATCLKLVDYLNVHGCQDLQARELATKFTTDNSVMCSYTLNAESFTNPDAEFLKVGRMLFDQTPLAPIKFTIMIFLPWLAKLLRIPILPKYVDTFFREFVKSSIESRVNAPAGDDFLQMLLDSAKTKKLPEIEIIGHSLSFFREGFETSSAILSYGMFELSRNPDVQNTLYDEITNVLAEFDNDFSYDALQKMIYLDAIVSETMRMYPILLTMHKTCTVPYEFRPLPGKKVGYKMPKGGSVAIPVRALHYDSEYYPNPNLFNPDRFLSKQRKDIPKGAFLGFGEGPRMCIGMRFGQTQVKVALATIVKSFRIKLSATTKPYRIDPKFFMNTSLDPILLNFEKRIDLN